MAKMRKWLERNEIFFKTFAAIVLSGMAIYVAWQANSIAENQTQILKQGQMPHIRITIDLLYDQEYDFYTEEKLSIYNDGAPLYNLNTYQVIFLEINYAQPNKPMQSVLIPINDYYVATIHTKNSTGEIATKVNSIGNRLNFFKIDQSFQELAQQKNAFGYIGIRRYVSINYKDVFDEKHSEIYYIDEINGSYKLSSISRVEQIPDLYDNAYPIDILLEFSEITPELLLEKWEDLISS